MTIRGFLQRVYAMAAKEALHIRRDPRTLYMALGMPVVMLLLFGYGIGFDVDKNPLAVVDADGGADATELIRAFTANQEFVVAGTGDATWATSLMRSGKAVATLVIPQGFGRDRLAGKAVSVQLLVDGVDGNSANQILAKADAIVAAWNQRALGTAMRPLVAVRVSTLWNQAGSSTWFMVPGLAAYLLAIAAVLLTALTVAGEWERGSMEQLFASPVGRLEIVLGKLAPYLGLGLVQLLLVVTLGATIFDVPVRGSVPLLFLVGFLFLVGMLGQGLLISVLAKNQLVATQAGALSSLLPSLILSGMIVPIENMPKPMQGISSIIPARYLVHAMRTLMLKGTGISAVAVDILALFLFAVAVLALSTWRFKRRLA